MFARRLNNGLLALGFTLLGAGLGVSGSADARVRPALPPGFDGGNQTSRPLTRIRANVNLMGLANGCFNPVAATPTDDVVGPHSGTTPAALIAFGGVNAKCVTPGPPDTQVAAGDSWVVEDVNGELAVFDRAGKLLKVVTTNSLFGVSGTCDPRIVFDPIPSPHWYATTLEGCSLDSGDSIDIAVSHGADPTGLWDIYRVFTAASNRFADQARLGFSSDKVLIDFTQSDQRVFCVTCWDDIMVVVEKSDLASLTSGPRAIDINMSTETNHRRKIIPAIPLPAAEQPTGFAVYRGSDAFGKYESTLVYIGLPSTGDVAFRETGDSIPATNNPDPAAQPAVNKNQIDPGREDVQSVSLIAASSSSFSGILWSAGSTKCSVGGEDRVCVRIDKVKIDSAGQASVTFNHDVSQKNNDLLDPAVVGDRSGNRVWIAESRTGTIFPTSELRLFTIGGAMHTIQYGSGNDPYVIDKFSGKDDPRKGLTRFGDYSGIFIDSTQPSGVTVWAATENAAISNSVGFNTSLVEATFVRPAVLNVSPGLGSAGDAIDVFGRDFSQTSAVRFGGVAAGSVTFLGSDHLRVTAPAQPPTTVNVFVTTLKGTNDPLPGPPLPFPNVADRFTYQYLLWSSGGDPAGDVVAIDPIADKRHFATRIGNIFGTRGIAMSPDGRTIYATSPLDGDMAWLDATTGKLLGAIAVGVAPTKVTVSPDGKYAFVTDPKNTASGGAVIPVLLQTPNHQPQLQAPVPIADPRDIAVAANGKVFVSSGTAHQIIVLSYGPCPVTPRWCPTGGLNVPTGTPGPLAAGRDTIWLGVAGSPGLPPGLVYTISPSSPALSTPINLDRAPEAMAAAPDGHTAFAVTANGGASGGWIYPIAHNPPAPDSLQPAYTIPDGPVGGAAVSSDSGRIYVAGSTSGHINAAVVPNPYLGALKSGPGTSFELATNVPPPTGCGGGVWADPSRGVQFSKSPPRKNVIVTVDASVLYCPSQASGPGKATPTLIVKPPKTKACPKPFKIQNSALTLAAGTVSFSMQFRPMCRGKWTAAPSLASFIGPPPSPPGFGSLVFTVKP